MNLLNGLSKFASKRIQFMKERGIYLFVFLLIQMTLPFTEARAQEAEPIVKFYSIDEAGNIEVTPGESQTAQAPLDITMVSNINNPDNYDYICEWRIWSANENEFSPIVTRFEEETMYTLTQSGGYYVKLYVTFTQDSDTIEYESEPISIVISESKLVCPDGFSPIPKNQFVGLIFRMFCILKCCRVDFLSPAVDKCCL